MSIFTHNPGYWFKLPCDIHGNHMPVTYEEYLKYLGKIKPFIMMKESEYVMNGLNTPDEFKKYNPNMVIRGFGNKNHIAHTAVMRWIKRNTIEGYIDLTEDRVGDLWPIVKDEHIKVVDVWMSPKTGRIYKIPKDAITYPFGESTIMPELVPVREEIIPKGTLILMNFPVRIKRMPKTEEGWK